MADDRRSIREMGIYCVTYGGSCARDGAVFDIGVAKDAMKADAHSLLNFGIRLETGVKIVQKVTHHLSYSYRAPIVVYYSQSNLSTA